MGKLDRVLGALCVCIAGCVGVASFVGVRAAGSGPAYAAGLAQTPASVTMILALLTAIPGLFLLFRRPGV